MFTKKEDYKFQVECLSYLNLKHKKAFKEQVDKSLSYQFDFNTSTQMKKTLKQKNTRVISLITFYEIMKLLFFKVLGVVVYFLFEKYAYVDYLNLQREPHFFRGTNLFKILFLMRFQELEYQKFY